MQARHRHHALAARATHVHLGAERRHRDRHVGGVRGHARLRVSENREVAVVAVAGRAAIRFSPAPTLVAGLGDVLEVGAARALEQVAADGGEVAQLARGAREQRLGEHRVALTHAPVGRELGVSRGRTDPQAAVGALLDRLVQPRDVDQAHRRLDAEAHQVDEVGASAEVADLAAGGGLGGGRDRTGGVGRALVCKRPHCATSAIAGTMFM